MQIEINLLPNSSGPRKSKAIKLTTKQLWMAGATAGVLMVVGIGFFFVSSRSAKREYVALNEEMVLLQPQQQRVKQVKEQLTLLQEKAVALSAFSDSHSLWSPRLEHLAGLVPEYMWLSELKVNDDEILELKGSALLRGTEGGAKSVGQFMKGLRANALFGSQYIDIDLESMQRREIKQAVVMDFELIFHPMEKGETDE